MNTSVDNKLFSSTLLAWAPTSLQLRIAVISGVLKNQRLNELVELVDIEPLRSNTVRIHNY